MSEEYDDIDIRYQELASAILAVAVDDYRYAYRRLLVLIGKQKRRDWKISCIKVELGNMEKDFTSDYYTILLKGIGSDMEGKLIPPFIRKQEEERYANSKIQSADRLT